MVTDDNNTDEAEVDKYIPDAIKEADRRHFLTSAASMFGAVSLAGCSENNDGGENNDGEEGRQTASLDNQIHFLTDYNSGDWKPVWQELIQQFEAEEGLPVNLEYTGLIGSGGPQRLANLYQAGDPPEMYTTIPNQIMDIILNGDLASIEETFNSVEEEVGPYTEQAIARLKVKGNWTMVPTGVYLQTMHYPTTALEQVGMNIPETRGELLKAAEVIGEDSDLPTPYALSGQKTGKSSPEFLHYLMNGDGWVFEWEESGNYDLSNLKLTFREEDVVELMEFFDQLSEYSIDPSTVNYGKSFEVLSAGRVAMSHSVNAWPTAVAIGAGNNEIINNYEISMFPKKEGADPPTRGYAGPDGLAIFDTELKEDAKVFMNWWLGDLERNASQFEPNPVQYVPPSTKIVESDTYRNIELFQEYPKTFELNQQLVNEVMPEMAGPESEKPYNALLGYLRSFNLFSELMNRVLVQEESPKQAYRTVQPKLEERFEEGKEKFAN